MASTILSTQPGAVLHCLADKHWASVAVHEQMAVSSLDQTRDRTSGPWAHILCLLGTWPTEFVSTVSRDCFTFASIVRTNLDKYLQGVKPLMSEMLTGRATKFSHLLVLSIFASSVSPSLPPFLAPSPSQACFPRCFLTPTIWNSHRSLLRPSSRHLLGPDRDWTSLTPRALPVQSAGHNALAEEQVGQWHLAGDNDLQSAGLPKQQQFDNLEDSWHSFPQHYLFNCHFTSTFYALYTCIFNLCFFSFSNT